MAESTRASAIEVMKSSIEALEARVVEMKKATDLLAVSQGLTPPYGTVTMTAKAREASFTREELPSANFRIENGPSFSSDTQD